MSNPEKQHFVPKVYLRNFIDEKIKGIYGFKIKSPYTKESVKKYHPSQICYEHNIYTLKTNKILSEVYKDDPYYVEKNGFEYEETFIEKITSKLKAQDSINNNHARKLIFTLLNIKQRNVLFRDTVLKVKQVKKLLDMEIEALKQHRKVLESKLSQEDVDKFFEVIAKEAKERTEDDQFMSDLFISLLFTSSKGKLTSQNKLVDLLLKSKFHVFCSTPGNEFITSDNPGYFFHSDGKIENTKIPGAHAFCFPITPYRLFVITPSSQEEFTPIIKKIYYHSCDQDFVKTTNKATIINSIEWIYSNSMDTLECFRVIRDRMKANGS